MKKAISAVKRKEKPGWMTDESVNIVNDTPEPNPKSDTNMVKMLNAMAIS